MAYSNFGSYPTKDFPAATLPLDVELLLRIVAIQGRSKFEGDMQNFILAFLAEQGLEGTLDAKGNVYATKGEADAYPTMVAHMDTVHDYRKGYEAAISADGKICYAFYPTEGNANLSRLSPAMAQTGVGGDDRCGIYVALHMLLTLPAMKVAFFVEEETGGQGSNASNIDFFSNSSVVLQCDRKGHDDWVQTVSGTKVASDEFITSIKDLLDYHGYKVTQGGGFTDVGVLKQRGLGVCAANMSCGYYNPHSSTETIHLPALENTLNLCLSVLERVAYEKQPHVYTPYVTPARKTNLASNSFYPGDFGWHYRNGPLRNGAAWGYVKTITDPITGESSELHASWEEAKKYEEDIKKAAESVQTALDMQKTAEEIKAKKKELKDWIKEDGTWFYDHSKKHWHKVLPDEATQERWIVGYAKLMTDIPEAEKVWQEDWFGYDQPFEDGSEGFTARMISRYVHQDLQYAERDRDRGQTDLFSKGDDYVDSQVVQLCSVCNGELQPHRNGGEYYCDNCADWVKPLEETPASGLTLWRDLHTQD